jgi:MinD-like ATPase involved in chromosome partitioning or flagellar assembly
MVRKLSSEQSREFGFEPLGALQSHFDALAMQVRGWAGRRSRVLTLGVMGAASQVGTSLVTANLANSLAESSFSGQVALVAAENEQASAAGLIEVLAHEKQLEDCLVNGWRDNLKVLPFGKLAGSDSRTIPWAKLSDLVQRELSSFDFVLFDLVPTSASKFSQPIASQLDGLLLVCRSESEQTAELNPMRRFLRDFPVEILGKVINRSVDRGRAR